MAMRKIVVQAFEDPSRPQGGHAVILLRGVDSMPERPSIRLRPVEVGDSLDARGLWRGAADGLKSDDVIPGSRR